MQCQFAYDNSRRAVDWSFASTERQLRHDYETAMLNASYDEYVNNANCKAELAGNLSANFGYQYDALQSSNADDSSLSGMFESLVAAEAQNQVLFNAFQQEQGEIRSALQSQAATQFNNGNAANEIVLQTAVSGGDVQYLSQYYSIEAAALVADASAYAAYVAAMETAQQEFIEEQCRLEGLLLESLDTGVNIVDTGTFSLSFQVCFPAGFEVDLADGTTKKIEEFEGDEEVWARPHDNPTAPLKKCKVVRAFKNEPKATIKIVFDNGLELRSTAEHPFFVPEKGWVSCEKLEVGDACVDRYGELAKVVSKELVAEMVPVYNIEVEGAHTYYVGEDGKSLLVHNICTLHPFTSPQDCVYCTQQYIGNMSNLQEGLIYLGKKYKAVNFGTEINVFGEKLIGFVNAKVGTSFPIITVPVAQEWLDKHFEEEAGRGVARIFHIDNSRRFGALGLSNLHVGSSNPVQFLDLPEYSIGNNWVIQGRIGVNKEEIAIRNIGPAIKDAREGRVTGLFEQYVGGAGLRTRANYRLGGVILVFTVETAVQKSPSTGAAEIQGTGSTIINF